MDLKIIIIVIIIIVLIIACYFVIHQKSAQNGGNKPWVIRKNLTLGMLEIHFPQQLKSNPDPGFIQNDEQYSYTYDDWKINYGNPIGKLIRRYGRSTTLDDLLVSYYYKRNFKHIQYSDLIEENIPIILRHYPFWEASIKMLYSVKDVSNIEPYRAYIYNPLTYNELSLI